VNGGGAGLDARIAAQAARLAAKETKPDAVVTAAEIAAAPLEALPQPIAEVRAIAEVGAVLLSNGTVKVTLPEDREHFLSLMVTLIAQAVERGAAVGRQLGAEEATKAFAANPKLGPLRWFQQKFGRAARQEPGK